MQLSLFIAACCVKVTEDDVNSVAFFIYLFFSYFI